MSLSDLEAKAILSEADSSLTPEESLAVRAVARHETSYGEGWPEGHGKGSFNMGAIMTGQSGECSGFTHKDSNPEREFVGCFKVYPSREAGFRDLVKVMLKSNVRAAANKGDLRGIAQAMFDNHYYTGTSKTPSVNVDRYFTALRRNLDSIIAKTGERDLFAGRTNVGLSRILTKVGLLVIVGYAGKMLFFPPASKHAGMRKRGPQSAGT